MDTVFNKQNTKRFTRNMFDANHHEDQYLTAQKAKDITNNSLKQLWSSIKRFKECRQDLQEGSNFMREKQKEVLLNSQVIKKEVFDMADTMDIMSQVINYQNDKILSVKDSVLLTG